MRSRSHLHARVHDEEREVLKRKDHVGGVRSPSASLHYHRRARAYVARFLAALVKPRGKLQARVILAIQVKRDRTRKPRDIAAIIASPEAEHALRVRMPIHPEDRGDSALKRVPLRFLLAHASPLSLRRI